MMTMISAGTKREERIKKNSVDGCLFLWGLVCKRTNNREKNWPSVVCWWAVLKQKRQQQQQEQHMARRRRECCGTWCKVSYPSLVNTNSNSVDSAVGEFVCL
jgi:hypothetical protein